MTASRKLYLIYCPAVENDLNQVVEHQLLIEQGLEIRKVKLADISSIHVHEEQTHALLWIEQKDYPQALLFATKKKMSLGFLPVPKDTPSQFFKNLDLTAKFDNCLEIALHEKPFHIDLIQCNDEIVINGVNLLNQTAMTEFIGDSQEYKGLHKIEFQLKRFFHAFSLTPHPVTLTTSKGKTVTTAITGMVLLDFHNSGALLNLFKESISLKDGQISVAFFAPQSILSYLKLSSATLLSTQKKGMLRQIGYIRSGSITITSPVNTHFLVNNKPLTTKTLQLETLSERLRVNAGEKFRERQDFANDKESVSCDQLPQQESRIKYLSNTLPFFTHALESDFKDLFLSLKDNACTSSTYVLLMLLSSLLATLGLFLNSPSIVIGAMVLAPLMAPIISLSMGVLRSDADLSRQSLYTLSIGMLTALFLSALMAFILPFQEVTSEIEGRLNPSTLDLLVAILSGIAGALGSAHDNVAKSMPGVAIAVALVPPLCVSGIGLGWMNTEIFYGAMLLFLTNLTGIILAAGLSFMVMGFAPFSRAKKGMLFSFLLVAIISVPLYLSFTNMEKIAKVKKQLISQKYEIAGHTLQLRNVKIRTGKLMRISADLLTRQLPDAALLAQFEKQLSEQLQHPVIVELSVRMVTANHN